jgi:hypothetical protein
MSEPYFGERYSTSELIENTVLDPNDPADVVLVNETPAEEIAVAVDPLNEPLAGETPVVAAPVQEIPLGGAVAIVGPLDETRYHEAAMGEKLYEKVPLGGTIAGESQVINPIPYAAPLGETITHTAPTDENVGSLASLLNRDQSEHFRTLWNGIQGKFIDEPRAAVQQADALVSEVVEQITEMFASEHRTLEAQWNQGNDVSTEDLRQALRRYRSFFNRLVV